MVIDPSSPLNINAQSSKSKAQSSAANTQSAATVSPAPANTESDVSLSTTGKSLIQLEKNIQASPDVDSDKIIALKTAIESGSYQPNSAAIADKITQ